MDEDNSSWSGCQWYVREMVEAHLGGEKHLHKRGAGLFSRMRSFAASNVIGRSIDGVATRAPHGAAGALPRNRNEWNSERFNLKVAIIRCARGKSCRKRLAAWCRTRLGFGPAVWCAGTPCSRGVCGSKPLAAAGTGAAQNGPSPFGPKNRTGPC